MDGRKIDAIRIVLEETSSDIPEAERYRRLAATALGEPYAAVRLRDAIVAIFASGTAETVAAESRQTETGGIELTFRIKRRTVARRVTVSITDSESTGVTEQELLLRLNLLDPGATVTERALQTNADLIVEYLRERGYYRAEATYEQDRLQSGNDVAVRFIVSAGPRATIDGFRIAVEGANDEELYRGIRLKAGTEFTEQRLADDVERIRTNLRDAGFLAPSINEPRLIYDSESNTISVEIRGSAGPEVEVEVVSEGAGVGEGTQRRLLPVKEKGPSISRRSLRVKDGWRTTFRNAAISLPMSDPCARSTRLSFRRPMVCPPNRSSFALRLTVQNSPAERSVSNTWLNLIEG